MSRRIVQTATASVAAVVMAMFHGVSATAQQIPVDTCGVKMNVDVKAPAPGADPTLAKFLGVYTGGKWNAQSNRVCNALVVSEVRADGTATVRYIFGPTQDVPDGYFEKTDARLKNGKLFFYSKLGGEVWYTLRDDGSLDGEFIRNGYSLKLVERPKRVTAQR